MCTQKAIELIVRTVSIFQQVVSKGDLYTLRLIGCYQLSYGLYMRPVGFKGVLALLVAMLCLYKVQKLLLPVRKLHTSFWLLPFLRH